MKCEKCGFLMEDGAAFCGNCGAAVTEVAEEPIAKKKKSILPKVLIAVAAVVVIVVGLFFGLKDTIVSKFASLMPAEAQLQMAYKNAAEDFGEGAGWYITEVEKNLDMFAANSTKGTIAVEVNQLLLQQLFGMDIGVNKIYMDYEMIQNENATEVDAILGLAETDIISMDIIMDMEKGKMTMSVPEMSAQAIEMDLEMTEADMEVYNQMEDMYSSILPDAEYAEEFLPKYIEVIFKNIDEVEREKVTLEVDGISQKATCLTVTFNDDMVKKIGKDVVDELKKDKEFENYLKEIYETSMEMSGEEADNWAEEYAEVLDEIELMFEELAESEEVQRGIEFVTWVDSDNKIIGVEFDEAVSWKSAKKGKEIAQEFVVEDLGKVLIKGKTTANDFSGVVQLFEDEEEVFSIDIEKFEVIDEKINFIAEMTITSEMLEELTGESMLLGDITLRMTMSSTGNEADFIVTASVNNMECVSISIYGENSSDKKEIEYPDHVTTDLEAWSYTLDITKISENLKKSGLSEILLQALFADPDAL